MAAWPSTLPQDIHQQDFELLLPAGAVRSDMDAGKAYQRKRYTAAVEPFRARIWVDATQWQTLMDFWQITLGMGADEFTWKHPITGASATVRFVASEPPQTSVVAKDLFAVTMNLEVIP